MEPDSQIPPVEQTSPVTHIETSNRNFWKTIAIGMSVVSFGIALAVGGYLLGANGNKTSQAPTSQITTAPTPTPTPDPTANWKTYETSKFSIKYPPSWVLNNFLFIQSEDNNYAIFYSPDYEDDGGLPYVTKGFRVALTIKDKGLGYQLIDPTDTAGVVGITDVTWLGKKAQLVKFSYEGAYVRLETVETPKYLQLEMSTPVFETPQFKTFEDNKKDFTAVANSLKLK